MVNLIKKHTKRSAKIVTGKEEQTTIKEMLSDKNEQMSISKGTKKNNRTKKSHTKLQMEKKRKRATVEAIECIENLKPAKVRKSDDPLPKKKKWINKERVLVVPSRGITMRDRNLMNDLLALMPHTKTENKKNNRKDLSDINEMAEMKNCNKCIFFENRKRLDLYMWLSNIEKGPCVKFLIQNIHSMKELKLTGNCLKGSRPLLSFDKNFDNEPYWMVIKEILTQFFETPKSHPKSQPFFDHVFTFAVIDRKVYFRNYQIVDEAGELTEIGPRFVMNPITILDQSFSGSVIWTNSRYQSPSSVRSQLRLSGSLTYRNMVGQKIDKAARTAQLSPLRGDPTHEVFEHTGVDFKAPAKRIKKKKKKSTMKINESL